MTGRAERRRHLDRTVVTESGERVCECCGIVVDMQAAAGGTISPSDYARTAPVLGNHTLGHTSLEYDRIHHMLPPGAESRANRLNASMRPLRDICKRSGYGEPITAEAARLLRWAYARDLVRRGHRKEMLLACLYVAHHSLEAPVPLRTFLVRHTGSSLFCSHKKAPLVTRKTCSDIRLLKEHMRDRGAFRPLHGPNTANTSAKILWGLEGAYGRRTVLSAIRGLERTGAVLAGRTSNVIAAATLYTHLQENAACTDKRPAGAMRTKRAVAASCDVPVWTLGQAARVLRSAGFRPNARLP